MLYLEQFNLVDEDANLDLVKKIKSSYTDDEWFPLGFFKKKKLSQIDFEPITIFYGGNGSGKSSLLNLIAENFGFLRHADVAVTKAFTEFALACTSKTVKNLPDHSKMLTSEDIFKNIFGARKVNTKVHEKKSEVEEFYDYGGLDHVYAGVAGEKMLNKNLAKKQFVQKKAGFKNRQFSNGENAMQFFKEEIQKKTLYLLDEPENSLSPQFQLDLKQFLEDCVKYHGCQFVIATHSPFILALKDAKIYNLDRTPVLVEKWHDLKNIRVYYDFFKKNMEMFELGVFDKGGAVATKKATTKKTASTTSKENKFRS